MNDDALPAVWIADPPIQKDTVLTAINAVLDEDRACRGKERSIRVASVLALALLCPALLWCAAYGITPLVRGGYALMAAGTAVLVSTEWIYLAWSRQTLPGPADARSQLQKTAFVLARQARLMRTAALWCAPVFMGTALIGVWLFQERSQAEGYMLWAIVGMGWGIVLLGGAATGRKIDRRRVRDRAVAERLDLALRRNHPNIAHNTLSSFHPATAATRITSTIAARTIDSEIPADTAPIPPLPTPFMSLPRRQIDTRNS